MKEQETKPYFSSEKVHDYDINNRDSQQQEGKEENNSLDPTISGTKQSSHHSFSLRSMYIFLI